MRVLVLHTLPPERTEEGRWVEEFDLAASAGGIAEALPGAVVAGVRGEVREMIEVIAAHAPDVIVNLCEAPLGQPRLEPHAAALFEWLGVPFTGSGSEALALCRRKDLTKAVLQAAGAPVPRAGVYPAIVKPADEDGSAGIHAWSVCANEEEQARAVARLRGPALIEEFLPGREFAVSLWGKAEPCHASVGETLFLGGVRLNTYEGKWDTECYEYRNTPLVYDGAIDAPLRAAIVETARRAWRATGLRGYARIDIRLDAGGAPCVLDVNPNPALNPGVGVHRAAQEIGWSWADFVRRQIEWAL
jgi:D-alanine-D-alanine ligase